MLKSNVNDLLGAFSPPYYFLFPLIGNLHKGVSSPNISPIKSRIYKQLLLQLSLYIHWNVNQANSIFAEEMLLFHYMNLTK